MIDKIKSSGRILLFYGDGKGKTTAALGCALRAAGRGLNVFIVHFIKKEQGGEQKYIAAKNSIDPGIGTIEFSLAGLGFVPSDGARLQPHIEAAKKAMELAARVIKEGRSNLVILDEILTALTLKLLSVSDVVSLIENKPAHKHMILTGRVNTYHPELFNLADTITHFQEIKHKFSTERNSKKGIVSPPQIGIEL